jgi:hypothetical protein
LFFSKKKGNEVALDVKISKANDCLKRKHLATERVFLHGIGIVLPVVVTFGLLFEYFLF